MDARERHRLGDRGILDATPVDHRASSPGARHYRRKDTGDPAADRPCAAGSHRSSSSRRDFDSARLRCPAGRRGHEDSLHYRCYVALHLALAGLIEAGKLKAIPLKDQIAAISVGIVDGDAVLDLDYNEDSAADVDMNVVMTGGGEFVELQGTGEEATFDRNQLEQMLELADSGIKNLLAAQRAAIGSYSWHNAQFL